MNRKSTPRSTTFISETVPAGPLPMEIDAEANEAYINDDIKIVLPGSSKNSPFEPAAKGLDFQTKSLYLTSF